MTPADGSAVVLDARDRARFRGDTEPIDPRAGHIPGARSLPCRRESRRRRRFLAVPVLRERFASVGVTDGADVVSYCGSGVTACHNLLAIEHAGLGVGRSTPAPGRSTALRAARRRPRLDKAALDKASDWIGRR
jgi:thiosulfate/3-mercaptopyruvate sulfurtransferase